MILRTVLPFPLDYSQMENHFLIYLFVFNPQAARVHSQLNKRTLFQREMM